MPESVDFKKQVQNAIWYEVTMLVGLRAFRIVAMIIVLPDAEIKLIMQDYSLLKTSVTEITDRLDYEFLLLNEQ